ncbi:MAG: hypothetical protein ACOZQL_40460 [Myxococcota bacterium]
MPTTHVQYAETEVSNWKKTLDAASAALSASQGALTTVRDAQAAHAAALKAAEDAVTKARAVLAAAEPSTPTTTAAEAVATTTATFRALLGRTVELAAQESRLALEVTGAEAHVATSRAALARAQSALEQAGAGQQLRTRWLTALRASPLTTVKADATAIVDATGNTLLADAEKKFTDTTKAHLPDELYQAARARFGVWWARRTAASASATATSAALATAHATDGGKDGAERQKWVAFEAAKVEAAAALDAADRLAAAQRVLNELIALGTAQALSAEESSRAAAATPSAGALTRLGAIVTKQLALDAAEVAYRDAVRTTRAKNPTLTAAQVDADGTVAPLLTALGTARTELADAQTAAAGDLPAAHAWALTLTEATWRRLHDFLWAKATLEALKAGDASTDVATRLETAEGAWADAALAAAARARTLAFLDPHATTTAQQARAVTDASPTTSFAALRGDDLFEQ